MASSADDYSNDIHTSGTLTPATPVMGMIEAVNDLDWFKVSLKAGQVYTFGMVGGYSTPDPASKLHPALALLDDQGQPVQPVIADSHSVDATLSYYAKASGTYYLQASAQQGNTGGYSVFMTESVPWWWDGSLGKPAATDVGSDANGRIRIPAQTDLYAFKLEAGTSYVFDLLGDGAGNGTLGAGAGEPSLQLLTDTGGLPDTANAVGIGGDPRVSYTPATSGTYYARVRDANFGGGTYVLKSWVGGSPAADTLADTAAADILDGGAGLDIMRYAGKLADFTVSKTGGAVQVAAKAGGATDVLTHIERIQFADGVLAFDADGAAGQAYRLYQAALNRAPDLEGLGYWIKVMDGGASLKAVAAAFTASKEFHTLYGDQPSNDALVTNLYANVLHRAPEKAGFDYWVDVLNKGNAVGDVLAYFSESPENQAALAAVVGNGFAYTPYG